MFAKGSLPPPPSLFGLEALELVLSHAFVYPIYSQFSPQATPNAYGNGESHWKRRLRLQVLIIFLIVTSLLSHLPQTGQACVVHCFPAPGVEAGIQLTPGASVWTGQYRVLVTLRPHHAGRRSHHTPVLSLSLRPGLSHKLLCCRLNLCQLILESLVLLVLIRTSKWHLYRSLNNFPSSSLPKRKDDKVRPNQCHAFDKVFQKVGPTCRGKPWRVPSSELYGKPSWVPLCPGRQQPRSLAPLR